MKTFAAIIALIAMPAYAQALCAPSPLLRDSLIAQPQVGVVWRGLSDGGHLIEVWRNRETGEWVAVRHTADGIGCIVDQGMNSGVFVLPNGDPA